MRPLDTWDLERTWDTFAGGTFHSKINGIELQKCDEDLARYRRIIEDSRPDILIETGTRAGGSAMWFHSLMGLQVITIDIGAQFVRHGGPPYRGSGIEWIRGSSISEKVMRQVLPLIEGKRVMVSLDADHHSAHVQAEIAIWGPMVSPGCYLVVEDACFDMFHRVGQSDWARVGGSRIPEFGGPLDAIERQLEHPLGQAHFFFDRDTEVEALYPISHSPCGYWRRHD